MLGHPTKNICCVGGGSEIPSDGGVYLSLCAPRKRRVYRPTACSLGVQQPRAKEFLGADGSFWFCTASRSPLGVPFPRIPCSQSMLQVQDLPLHTQHSRGRGLHQGVECGPQILTGERSHFLGRSCPSPSTQTLVSWRGSRHQARWTEGAGTRLDGHWSLLLLLLSVLSPPAQVGLYNCS